MAEFAGGTPAQKHRIDQRSPNGSFSADRTMIQREFDFDQNSECSRVEEVASLPELPAPTVQLLAEYASVKKVSMVYESSLEARPHICGTDDAKQFFQRYWQRCPGNDQERFVVACLDTKNRVQSVVVVTVGTLDASLVHPREVFKPAIIEGSSSVILSHNHPSGNTTPSREDFQVTDRLTKAGELLGITVLDHIVHGDGTGQVASIRERQ